LGKVDFPHIIVRNDANMTIALSDLSLAQLRRAVGLREQIEALTAELDQIEGHPSEAPDDAVAPRRGRPPGKARRKRRTMTPAALNALAQARAKRWANVRAASAGPAAKPKKKFSAAARAALSAAAKARWRKAKAAGRSAL